MLVADELDLQVARRRRQLHCKDGRPGHLALDLLERVAHIVVAQDLQKDVSPQGNVCELSPASSQNRATRAPRPGPARKHPSLDYCASADVARSATYQLGAPVIIFWCLGVHNLSSRCVSQVHHMNPVALHLLKGIFIKGSSAVSSACVMLPLRACLSWTRPVCHVPGVGHAATPALIKGAQDVTCHDQRHTEPAACTAGCQQLAQAVHDKRAVHEKERGQPSGCPCHLLPRRP